MDDGNLKKMQLVHYLIVVTTVFYGALVLFLRLKGNFSTSLLWPFIRIGCKWSLFAWFFYGGVYYGRKLSLRLIESLNSNLKSQGVEMKNAQAQNGLLQMEIEKLKRELNKQIERTETVENYFTAKLERLERTAEEANSEALKNFV